MLPLTTKEPISLTIDQITYLIGVPTIAGRASFRRALTSEGLRYPTDEEMLECLKAGINEVVKENQKQELLKVIDKYSTKKENKKIAEIEKTITASYPPYAELAAERGFYLTIAPLLACRHFLKGIENSNIPFELKNNFVPFEILDQIPEAHIAEIGWQAISLLTPSENQIKN